MDDPLNGTPQSVRKIPEPDGSHFIKVKLETGQLVNVKFDPGQVAELVEAFQLGMIENAAKAAKPLGAVGADLLSSLAGTGPEGPQVQVSIEGIGLVVLNASDDKLLKLKADIDRALKMRAEKKAAH